MVENGSKKLPKVAPNFLCEICDYNTSKKSSYDKHLTTAKHINHKNGSKSEKLPKVAKNMCICGKIYSYNTGYYRHKKTCNYKPLTDYSHTTADTQNIDHMLILELIKDNKDIKEFMIEQHKHVLENHKQSIEQNKHFIELAKLAGHNTTYTNSHNTNKFNINMFLNDKCKDALNISDFVSQLEVDIKDLEETGRLGFADGISKIFVNGLKQLEVYDRPIHCNDSKREVLYIKSNNKWEKEDDNKPILTKAIKEVAHKNMKQIKEWQKINTDYSDPDSKQNDKYLRIVSEAMSGSSVEESEKNYNKIIKKLVKETTIPTTEK